MHPYSRANFLPGSADGSLFSPQAPSATTTAVNTAAGTSRNQRFELVRWATDHMVPCWKAVWNTSVCPSMRIAMN